MPPIIEIVRTLVTDDRLLPCIGELKKDDHVSILLYSLARVSRYWSDSIDIVEVFEPERFSDENLKNKMI